MKRIENLSVSGKDEKNSEFLNYTWLDKLTGKEAEGKKKEAAEEKLMQTQKQLGSEMQTEQGVSSTDTTVTQLAPVSTPQLAPINTENPVATDQGTSDSNDDSDDSDDSNDDSDDSDTGTPAPAAKPTAKTAQKPTVKTNFTPYIIIGVILIAMGVAYFKFVKKKK
jgi:cobalamin biosynthesis Mg chelatase CobN